ncbi:MAG: hypothetical protein A3D10_00580 [Omnitrophica WOR_2 bacterium RIFCSPHIGHO2_02_FULL_48_11]|nr:MAG: hypothetical protein A3D10_00580 [Omnitrophica WOR_2 bacterium RIFCSPHIGHO2_02_FULL_48_11]
MIDAIKQRFTPGMDTEQKLNAAREFLQILALKTMSDKKFFDQVAFVGGTSLRILYDIRRFSEDLDFSLIRKQKYDFGLLQKELLRSFQLNGLPCEANLKTQTNVHNMMLKFPGLLKELGLSALPAQKFSIKLVVDTNPPAGWVLTDSIISKIYTFRMTHYDLASLFAGKLHACFYRKFTKGRDFYDFVWYLGKRVKPNLALLNNAIAQTQGKNPGLDETNLKPFLLENIKRIDFAAAKKDVERFLEDKSALGLFNLKAMQGTIETVY